MNLIERPARESTISIFRSWQYSMRDELLLLGLNYLIDLGLPYDENIFNRQGLGFEYAEDQNYHHIHHFATTRISVSLSDTLKKFVDLSIPDLIHGTFFKLNSTYYVPMMYISDEPIVMKENSISLQSLFQPMTLYFSQKRAIFMGINFPLSDIFQIISHDWDKDDIELVEETFNIDLRSKTLTNVVNYFSEKLNTPKDPVDIKNKINQLFFDQWTSELYHKFYGISSNIDDVFLLTTRRKFHETKPSFIDLRYKRLTFIEHILRPFFKSISIASSQLVRNNQVRKLLNLKLVSIVQHFHSDLNGNNLYDTTNGFSGILSHKASFKNPYGESRLPKEVSSIHWTHRGRICPNSITNQDPGESVLLVPDQEIDFRYGIFSFTDEEKEKV